MEYLMMWHLSSYAVASLQKFYCTGTWKWSRL